MKRVALLAAVIFPVAVLFYAFHGSSKASTPPPKPSERDQPPLASAPSSPSLSVTQPVIEHANVDGLPPVVEPGYLAVEHAAKKCWHDRNRPPAPPIRPNGPDETIETIQLSYREVSDHGVGHVEDLKVAHDKFTDQALQACIVKAGAMVTWSSTAPDGMIGTVEQNLNIGDLMRPPPSLPPDQPPPPANQGIEEAHETSATFDPGPGSIPKK